MPTNFQNTESTGDFSSFDSWLQESGHDQTPPEALGKTVQSDGSFESFDRWIATGETDAPQEDSWGLPSLPEGVGDLLKFTPQGQMYTYANQLVLGGGIDTAAMIPNGLLGLVGGATNLLTGGDAHSAMDVAADTINRLNEAVHNHISQPIVNFMLPEELETTATMAHNQAGNLITAVTDKFAEAALYSAAPQLELLRQVGVDTTEMEGALDGLARGSAITAATVLPFLVPFPKPAGKGGRKPQRGEMSPEDMDAVLNETFGTYGKNVMSADVVNRVMSEAKAKGLQVKMPEYDAVMGRLQAKRADIESYGTIPSQPELPLGQAKPLRNEPGSPQLDLFKHQPSPRHTLIPDDAPVHPLSPDVFYRVYDNVRTGEVIPRVKPLVPARQRGRTLEGEVVPEPKALERDPFPRMVKERMQEKAATPQKVRKGRPEPAVERKAHQQASPEAKQAYENYIAHIDEVNYELTKQSRSVQDELPTNKPKTMAGVVRKVMETHQGDIAGFMESGLGRSAAESASAGMARLRVQASVTNEANFITAMQRILEMDGARAFLKATQQTPEGKAVMTSLISKISNAVEYGGRVADIVQKNKNGHTEIPGVDRQVHIPGTPGSSPHIARMTLNELVTIYRELLTAQPAMKARGFKPVSKQEFRPGAFGDRPAQEGILSARGEFYTPAEASLLQQLINTVRKDLGVLSTETRTTLQAQADAISKARELIRQEAGQMMSKKQTLADYGIEGFFKKYEVNKAHPGEQGYLNFEALNLMDPVLRRWKQKHERVAQKGKSSRDRVVTKAWPAGAFIREVLGGGKMIGQMQRYARDMAKMGKYEAMKLVAMLDHIPKQWYPQGMGFEKIRPWHEIYTQAMADLIISSSNGVSLSSILKPFQGKVLTGVRRYARHLPGGLTPQRIRPKMIGPAFRDLTANRIAQTPLGQTLQGYFKYVYDYTTKAGVETATYLHNYYPVILRLNRKNLDAFRAAAAAKGHKPWAIEEIIDSAVDGNGLVTSNVRRSSKNPHGKQLNLEKRREFFKDWLMEELRPYIVDDPVKAAYMYARGAVRSATDAARFGAKEQIWDNQYKAMVREGIENGNPVTTHMEKSLQAARQIMGHTYYTLPPWMATMMRAGIAGQQMAKLGMVTVASLSETALGLINPTTQRFYAQAMSEALTQGIVTNAARAIVRDSVPMWRGRELADAIGRSAEVEMHDVLTATHAADMGSTATNITFLTNGLHSLTNMMQDINVRAFELGLRRHAKSEFELAMGKRKESDFMRADRDFYNYYGVDKESLMRWYRDGGRVDGHFWDQTVAPSMIRYLNDTVMTPRGVNLPRWMNHPWMAPIRSLMTYTTMYANTVLPNIYWGLQGGVFKGSQASPWTRGVRGAQTLGGLSAIIGLGYLSVYLRDLIHYGGTENHPLVKKKKWDENDPEFLAHQTARIINQTGAYGFAFAKAFDLVEQMQYGMFDPVEVMQGALYSEILAAGTLIGMGVASGDINARTAARWIVRNGYPAGPLASALPRDEDGLMSDFLPSHLTRDEMVEDIANWLDDHVPGVKKKYKKKYKPY